MLINNLTQQGLSLPPVEWRERLGQPPDGRDREQEVRQGRRREVQQGHRQHPLRHPEQHQIRERWRQR